MKDTAMNCETCWELAASENPSEQAAAERHVAACEHCQTERQALEAVLRPWSNHLPLSERERQLWLMAAVDIRPVALARASQPGILAWAASALAALAIVLLAAVVLRSTTSRTHPSDLDRPPLVAARPANQSAISIIPLTLALCFGQIEQDLQTSSARAEEVSEELALIEIERDLQDTLDSARKWAE